MGGHYRVGDLAELTGVSIRTLHHYDEIGLLRPATYTEGGYRLYSDEELLRLQQILTLRYLGFGLASIGALLERPDFQVLASLRVQRGVLRDRISELERIDAVLEGLIADRVASGRWDWDLVAGASATVQGSLERGGTMQSYYTPEQMKQFEELRAQTPPREIEAVQNGWSDLMRDVRASMDLDPASPEAQALADRWDELTERVRAGFASKPELMNAIGENYKRDAFREVEGAPRAEDFAFIERIKAARGGQNPS